jgi:hypothetical protein
MTLTEDVMEEFGGERRPVLPMIAVFTELATLTLISVSFFTFFAICQRLSGHDKDMDANVRPKTTEVLLAARTQLLQSSPPSPGLVREMWKAPPGLVRGISMDDDEPPFLERGLSRSFTSGLRKPTADMASAEQRQALWNSDHQGSSRSIRSDGAVCSRTLTATGGSTGTLLRVSSSCKTLSEDAKTAKGDLKRPPKASKSMSSGSRYFAEIIRRQCKQEYEVLLPTGHSGGPTCGTPAITPISVQPLTSLAVTPISHQLPH